MLAGVNFLLSRFLKTIMDFYGVRLADIAPNSVLMLSAFALLCEVFVGVRASLRLWWHFFVLRPGGQGMVFGDLHFQSWPNYCSVYIPTEFPNKWDAWRASWFYIQMEKNHHLKRPVTGTPSRSAWELAPEMDERWLPVLEWIKVLVKAGLTTTLVLAHAVACGSTAAAPREGNVGVFRPQQPDAHGEGERSVPTASQIKAVVRACIGKAPDDVKHLPTGAASIC